MNRSVNDFKFCIVFLRFFIIIPYTCATHVEDIQVLFRHLDCWLFIEFLYSKFF